ncbi:MAG: hypothetical protein NTX97_14935 [Bacteroidetes bacterium]|nr:hypothetical protein [Bacteroidota bacterium]
MQLTHDYIVVGSGATGAIAAHSLIESGVNVAMLDIGIEDEQYKEIIPNKDFISIRKEEKLQHEYFLGKQFEGIPWETSKVGSQLTPPRNFLTRFAEKYIPFESDSFKPMESLATGGLGGGWGLGCYVFSKPELEAIGLKESEMMKAYEAVAANIGISGAKDDGSPYCLRDLQNVMPVSELEQNLNGVFSAYDKQKNSLNSKGVFLGRSALALLTKEKDGRSAVQYKDMDFWSDKDRSSYRSWMTIDQLKGRPNFSYHKNCLVLKFVEHDAGIDVIVKRTDTNEEQIFTCKKLILAPGVLGTARIVIRSFNHKKVQLPVICNPYCYIPTIQWRMLGKEIEQNKTSLGQLVLYLDEKKDNFDVGMAALFSYRSLLLFKLIKETPLNFADARIIMQYLQSSFTIAGIHHPEKGSSSKFIRMMKNADTYTGDILTGQYILSDLEIKTNELREGKIRAALRKLGCQPLKTVHTPHGGSIHYAGTLPFNNNGEEFTLHPDGKLAGTKNVFVADGSGFNYLPAKGLTFTLMANAYNVAKNALKNE